MGINRTIELREFQEESWLANLGEISLRVDQHLGRILGLKVTALERAKLSI